MQKLGFADREAFLEWSREQPEQFWDAMVQEMGIRWFEPYAKVLDISRGVEWGQWFIGGKLNIVDNCLDRWVASGRTAIIAEDDGRVQELTFDELSDRVSRLANYLKSLGLVQGDRVSLVMPMTSGVVTALYACLKLGLVAVPIFGGFGAGAIASRLADCGARAVIAGDRLKRRGKWIDLREKVDEAIAKAGTAPLVVSYGYEDEWGSLLDNQPADCETVPLDSEATALLLYTSGTTGKPKGTVHPHAGALAQITKEIYLGFDHRAEDRFFWLSDIGWIMGSWTILGNHCLGGTIFLYDGAPDFPEPDRLWQIIERHRLTTFGLSPTAIRVLMRVSHPENYPMETLRLLGSTGEPWDETSYLWYFENIGRRRCPIINISGGTEIAGSFLSVLPIQGLKPCSLGSPAPGMAAEVVDDGGHPVRGRTGHLVCTKPTPSMTRGIWGDPQRYLETYWRRWPGWWEHGDWAGVDEDGCWFIHGRADESMNVAGRKVGPAEVEEALMEHPAVSEAAVIGVPDAIKGETIVAFVVLKEPVTVEELSAHLVKTMGAMFRPRAIEPVTELPKTQSGKVVRRLLRRKYLGEELGDTSTVQNPAALDTIVNPAN